MKKLAIFIIMALLLLCATPVYASEIPKLPHAFYGSVTVTGINKLAPVGSTVEASVVGVVTGIPGNPTTISAEPGIYGTSNPFQPRLIVQGTIEDGANITFYVQGYVATTDPATVEWHSGEITKVDLAVPAVAPEVATNAATSVTTSSATLNSNLANLGTALSADVSFQWGATTAYGRETTIQTLTSTGSFTFSLSGLSDDTTYHFRAKAVGDGTDYGADRSFTTGAEAAEEVGVAAVGAPPELPPGTTDVRGRVSDVGVFEEPVTAISEDELCTLTIAEGTVGLTKDLEPLDEVVMVIMDEPPPPPEEAEIVGLAYDFGPDGATFDPPITLEYTYDPDDIPEGVAEEDLVLAMWDEEAGEWVELPCTVDPVTHTITASVSHFTTFAIIAPPPTPPAPPAPAPAAFALSSLSVSPAEVTLGETATISLSVANTGGTEGSYSVVLKINGVKEAEKSITIAAGDSQDVSFSVSREEAGSYSVTVDGLSASFSVVALAPPEPEKEKEVEGVEEAVPPAKPINWPVLGGVIAGIIVIGLLMFFLVRRRRAY